MVSQERSCTESRTHTCCAATNDEKLKITQIENPMF